jgi:hypothetical protein
VGGVQFRLGAANLGAEDTSAPYSVSWDTTTVAAGSYSLTAVARDSATQTTTSTTVTVTVNNPPQNTALVAAYGFNAGSGTAVADSSGRGNAGTSSGPAWNAGGRYGSALSFDGINDWVTIPDANSLDLTTGMTLEAWVRPTSLGGWRTVVFKERPGGMLYSIYAFNRRTGFPVAQTWLNNAEQDAHGTAALPLSAWTHLASVYDGGTLRLYVNGVQAGTQSVSGSLLNSASPLRIGGNSIWNEYFNGQIDDVRLYNRALTPTEIQSDMSAAVG